MTPIADMVRVMLERDVPRDVIVTVVEHAERHAQVVMSDALRNVTNHDAKIKAAERSKRYRDNKKRDAGVTPSRDAAKPPLNLTSSPSKDSEVQKEGKKERARKHPFPPEFQPNAKHFEAAEKLGRPRQFVLDKAEDMRLWAASSGEMKADWGATLHGFIRRDVAKFHGNSNGGRDEQKSVLAAFDRLEQHLSGGDDNAEREGDLLSLPPR